MATKSRISQEVLGATTTEIVGAPFRWNRVKSPMIVSPVSIVFKMDWLGGIEVTLCFRDYSICTIFSNYGYVYPLKGKHKT